MVDGVRIITCNDFKQYALKEPLDELIFAVLNLPVERKNEIVDICLDQHIKVLNVPPVQQWVEGSFSAKQLKSVKIEQLLERDSIKINNKEIGAQIKHRRILVTGAAGSIGSEIVRQLVQFHPEMIVLCDQAETPLHHLQLALEAMHPETICIPRSMESCGQINRF